MLGVRSYSPLMKKSFAGYLIILPDADDNDQHRWGCVEVPSFTNSARKRCDTVLALSTMLVYK